MILGLHERGSTSKLYTILLHADWFAREWGMQILKFLILHSGYEAMAQFQITCGLKFSSRCI